MFDALFRYLAESHYVVNIDDGELPRKAGKDDVHRVLDRSWRIAEFKMHFNESIKFVVRGDSCLVFAFVLDLDMPVSPVIVRCEEDGSFAELVDTFVYARYGVRV